MTNFCYELRDIHKRYDGHHVLQGFDLKIDAGEMVAIAGPSGSGKSTILNLMGLMDSPDAGELTVFGERAPRVGTRAATRVIRNHIGYLFQNFALIDNDTVARNLQVALTYASERSNRARRIAEVLERVGLSGFERRKVFSLSGGEQQRVAIARLMLKPCNIVLADEPTGSVDAANRNVILSLLRSMNDEGKAVVVVSHDDAVIESCSRVVMLG